MQTLGVVAGYGSHYYSPGGRCFVKVEPTDTPYGYLRRNAFRQPILERQLREGLERFSHIETRFGSTLETLTQDTSGVVIGITGPEDLHTRIASTHRGNAEPDDPHSRHFNSRGARIGGPSSYSTEDVSPVARRLDGPTTRPTPRCVGSPDLFTPNNVGMAAAATWGHFSRQFSESDRTILLNS